MYSGSVAPKEMTNLQHELESLKRRQSDLEDQELELMERLEVAEKALTTAQQGLDKAREDRERAEQQRCSSGPQGRFLPGACGELNRDCAPESKRVPITPGHRSRLLPPP